MNANPTSTPLHTRATDRATARLAGALVFGTLGAVYCGAPALRLWVLLVAGPIAEEIVFRLGLHESLLRLQRTRRIANLATALVFGLLHGLLRGSPEALLVFFPALLVGLVYERWRAVTPCIVLHAAMNGLWWWVHANLSS